MIVLRTYSPFPPGSFPYEQPVPGQNAHIFKEDGLSIEQQAKRVLAFRLGNKLPGASLTQVVQDISIFTCVRLGGMTQWCLDTDAPIQVFQGNTGGGCSTCGRPVNA